MPANTPERDIYSVSRLNREVNLLLQSGFPVIWVAGELSNLSRPGSGHWYFTLKDRDAQVRCAMFRQRNISVRFKPADGQQVLARARVGLYEPRGDYQLIVEHLEETGVGALQREFERLRDRLAAEGLFSEDIKRPLPAVPRCIGVITSPSGAAIRDILQVLGRRFPLAPVIVYPVPVQGAAAAPAIVQALQTAGRRAECDVLILARGGGSLEDLWAFNDERVARAIRAVPLPVVTGIGHEVDFTIADFAADLRAPTPTAAAQRVVPDWRDLDAQLAALRGRIGRALRRQLREFAQLLGQIHKRLQRSHPGVRLLQHMQRLDELQVRLQRAVELRLQRAGERLAHWRAQLRRAAAQHLERTEQRLALAARALQAVSPLATLERGFAIVTEPETGRALRTAAEVQIGADIDARLARGRLRARVTGIDDER